MTQQQPNPQNEEPINEEDDGKVAPDREDYFTWKPGDLVFEEHVWDVSFQDPEGNLHLVTELEDFIRWLQISELTLTEFMHRDVAEYMPKDLKAAIEERIGSTIEYLGRNLPKDKQPPKDVKIANEEKLTG